MKAVVLTGHGGLDKLEYRDDYPDPVPEKDEALVKVHACGLNNTDINTRTAWYSKGVEQGITENAVVGGYSSSNDSDASWGNSTITFPRIQGADVSGTVIQVGTNESHELVGQRVMIDPWFLDSANPHDFSKALYFGSEVDGGYAEYAIAPVDNVHKVDSALSDAELATFACAYTTAENLISRTGLKAGETIVISGASGGVGTAAIQLARVREAKIIAISSAGKESVLRDLGAETVINRSTTDMEASIKEAANGEVDVAVDVVGGNTFSALINSLRQGGRYSSSGCISGPIVDFDLRKLIYRDLQLTGATVVPAGTFAKLVEYIEQQKLNPVLAETYPLEQLAQAQESFMRKKHVGNIVVTMES